jgi:hypothetical protein
LITERKFLANFALASGLPKIVTYHDNKTMAWVLQLLAKGPNSQLRFQTTKPNIDKPTNQPINKLEANPAGK